MNKSNHYSNASHLSSVQTSSVDFQLYFTDINSLDDITSSILNFWQVCHPSQKTGSSGNPTNLLQSLIFCQSRPAAQQTPAVPGHPWAPWTGQDAAYYSTGQTANPICQQRGKQARNAAWRKLFVMLWFSHLFTYHLLVRAVPPRTGWHFIWVGLEKQSAGIVTRRWTTQASFFFFQCDATQSWYLSAFIHSFFQSVIVRGIFQPSFPSCLQCKPQHSSAAI